MFHLCCAVRLRFYGGLALFTYDSGLRRCWIKSKKRCNVSVGYGSRDIKVPAAYGAEGREFESSAARHINKGPSTVKC